MKKPLAKRIWRVGRALRALNEFPKLQAKAVGDARQHGRKAAVGAGAALDVQKGLVGNAALAGHAVGAQPGAQSETSHLLADAAVEPRHIVIWRVGRGGAVGVGHGSQFKRKQLGELKRKRGGGLGGLMNGAVKAGTRLAQPPQARGVPTPQ